MRTSLLRTAVWALVYLLATIAGRKSIIDGSSLSLVWPAAGVSVLWFATQRRSRLRWLDPLALAAITVAVNTATGAAPVLACWFVVANLAQVGVFMRVLSRLSPHMWGAGGDEPLSRSADLWRLMAATVAGAAAGALVGPTAIWLTTGRFHWSDGVVWFLRNAVSMLLIGAVGFRLGQHRSTGWRPGRPSAARLAEYAALIVGSVAAYGAGFGTKSLPLAFPLLAVTVWAALRLHTTFVVLHALCAGTAAVLFTLHDSGPFAAVASHPVRALLAQAFIGMVTVLGLSIALGRDERDELLGRLTVAGREAASQARLLTTIVNSMSEGVSVIRPDGRWIMRNPAAVALMGGVTSGTETVARPDHYGLFHPDGTPLPGEEMAYVRALAGHDVRNQELLVRNSGVPDGRILSVSATRLPTDETAEGGAVVVFHDVTAERRHRDELSSFAGVVAHDLLNPLTTIDGWAENLGDTLGTMPSDDPAVRDAGDSLVRITRASGRMRHLINDLLAYTTARNAAIAPVDLALRDLVVEVTNARTDLAAAAGTPTPEFALGRLDAVRADPVLLRQLLDNLVGNAVKYTAPGITPRIAISSRIDQDGMVRVELSDNGIGIPPGHHDAIFTNFHRAHRTSGYAGTGLGLAICKRIVERHGGTIAASDNPDGGSRFVFTLPTANTPPRAAASQTHLPAIARARRP
ncbi:ATP-binding protein [Dactylosporangium sp. NPDC000555]|uniref:ATP-binding protein n=1 Tax=Dactylosporangium sp. NPDC000555 TaxID=3154260 RepID=UPI00332E70AF